MAEILWLSVGSRKCCRMSEGCQVMSAGCCRRPGGCPQVRQCAPVGVQAVELDTQDVAAGMPTEAFEP
jgi:hypothetical protein